MKKPSVLEEEDKKMPVLKVIEGGRSATAAGGPTGTNWLSELDIGCIFLCQDKTSKDYVLHQFEVVFKSKKSVRLFTNLNSEIYLWVDPIIFCNRHILFEVLLERRHIEDDD